MRRQLLGLQLMARRARSFGMNWRVHRLDCNDGVVRYQIQCDRQLLTARPLKSAWDFMEGALAALEAQRGRGGYVTKEVTK